MATKFKEETMTVTLTNSHVKDAVKTYTMSKRYMNNMFKATIINILFHRLDMDENDFITKNFNDVSYKSIRPKSKNPIIRELHAYLIAFKDALNKNYLRDFYLFLTDTGSGEIIENYKFSFQYLKNEPTNETQNADDLTETTCELLKTLEELGKHRKVDAQIGVKAEMTYFDDTPDDYEPPGFERALENDTLIKKIAKSGNSVALGSLFTGFHVMKCRGKGDIFNFNATVSTIHQDNITQESDTTEAVINNDIFTEDMSSPLETLQVQNLARNQSKLHDSYNMTSNLEMSSDEDSEIDCLCKLPVLEYVCVDHIQCERCKRRYHSPCQGFLDNSFLQGAFYCNYCTSDGESIVEMFENRKTTGLYRMRYIIGAMYKYGRVPIQLKSAFGDTVERLQDGKMFEFDGNMIKEVNIPILASLFKLDHKMLDVNKFKTI